MSVKWFFFVVLLALFAGFGAAPVAAANCQAEMSDVNFGSVSLRAGVQNRAAGRLEVTCSNALVSVVGVCVRFGAGSGGAASGNAPRYMQGGTGAKLAYQLSTVGYGSGFGTLNEVYLTVPILLGHGRASIPIYGEIQSTGTAFDTGHYQSVFSGPSQIEMSYGILSCNLFGQSHPVPDFKVSADTVASCELDVGAMDFGRISGLGMAPADATASVDVRCTNGTNYSVSMGLGEGSGVSDPEQRKMSSLGNTLTYGLFHDPGHSQVWGEAPASRVTGAGSGYDQRYTVYGRIYQGQQTQIGVYRDSVIVTVNY
ncbi:spore coat U domain-containing protein [Aquicoccus sp. G2-2]|uniref:Csu type fimbrial protein n=1 Tax=Aquicoccus sp. G2-2 TaxID=3092120 RepID=UPI002ADF11B1|nr:spore coat U domain-containing protein [Aquicoccus sp. G2-2]MEA1113606.1 spore coat U domain-containing protein [Aquicoccus sp. G2-2]